MIDKQIIIDGEHDMNYCKDNNCKYYGNKEQCKKTHCYYRCYSKLYTAHKRKQQECNQLRTENEELRKCYKNNSTLLDFEETNTTKLVNKVMKLKQTLAEIKFWVRELFKRTGQVVPYEIKQILQKISECEVENDR